MSTPSPPMSLLAELTHRCPLACPYCSNPLELERRTAELDTATWKRVLDEAAALGVLQAHFSGGEPMARSDLVELVAHARSRDLYTNLITSGVMLDATRLQALAEAGLDHVQLSFQDVDEAGAERIGGLRGAQAKKLTAARLVAAEGIPLTLNFVVHRLNVERVPAMITLARELGASRVEIAHTQYYGWGLKNRGALLPTREQLEEATAAVEAARRAYGPTLVIDYVTPDYYADQPKPCMGGWGQRFVNISPSGRVLPCHAAETIPGVIFPNVRDESLSAIWNDAPLFTLFRGTEWMPEPCRSCALKETDWGGCRCQALALTGDAANTDPVCSLSPFHNRVKAAVEEQRENEFLYRRYENIPEFS
ncbi:pyrroloquinoline quinone biosynthesis protein PqqE [Acidomonas methanolica]|uniref:PqqA peptide cyclase n=1 Tax=Acidomonas methanolica NBRC 104435 TaxID=1231351 RepID=A0A023D7P7_ACIMT|nr:pyrroloquinoline quinone biosynthesis protein PqqE [Acidomonas methanolica]MBU2655242.1 pyrroloquinoline quinone biosynthesis protein PqqE [Acidomonas methanolica]TCS25586.1 pyrroloquinoline quinone biosynthesis protein E [Acidomonas methanolica]GAJ30172.1 pyrroloquinoline quinone (PQQ) biosynthesis protein PqqE [Acidomonas methanolica NBRC 104435]GBQ51865.1 pyrroloquinoline quinone biosynthesis protein PqqE [Acidomonas methanolica]GEK98711.1 coenzyme PQQ synthesis protein E [Acidomonas met